MGGGYILYIYIYIQSHINQVIDQLLQLFPAHVPASHCSRCWVSQRQMHWTVQCHTSLCGRAEHEPFRSTIWGKKKKQAAEIVDEGHQAMESASLCFLLQLSQIMLRRVSLLAVKPARESGYSLSVSTSTGDVSSAHFLCDSTFPLAQPEDFVKKSRLPMPEDLRLWSHRCLLLSRLGFT